MNAWAGGLGSLGPVDKSEEAWIEVWRKQGWWWWQQGCMPLAGPFHVPWSSTTDQPTWRNSQLPLLGQQVPTGRWANSSGIKYSPSHRRQRVCLFLLYILFACHQPTGLYFLSRSFEVYVSALLLNKNSAWNKWCNCLHGQKCVYSRTGSLALSLKVVVLVLTYVFTEEFSCHIGY